MKKVLFILIALMIFIAIVLAAAGCTERVKPQSKDTHSSLESMYSSATMDIYCLTHEIGNNTHKFIIVRAGHGVAISRE
jgi:hypothetical protein